MAQNRTRTERIELRATPEEKKLMLAKAAAAGLTLTGYIMLCIGAGKAGEKIGDAIAKNVKK